MENEELIWVEKEFAEKYNVLKNDASKTEERIKIFNDYLNTIKEQSRQEFKSNLESLEEDVAMYQGLMIRVKKEFENAKNTQLSASYALWEKFEKEIPSVDKKISSILEIITPLEEKIKQLEEKLSKINSWNIEKFTNALSVLTSLYGNSEKMFKFLVNNFKEK